MTIAATTWGAEVAEERGATRDEATTRRRALRWGAVAALGGQALLIVASAAHPAGEHPADHPAVFAEYANDPSWTTVHLAQWVGGVLMFLAMGGLAHHVMTAGGKGALAGRLALAASVTVAAVFTVLQAVDGVALKLAVDAWVAAGAQVGAAGFSAAEAVRWSEIGLNALARVLQGVAVAAVAIAATAGGLHGRRLAVAGVVAGVGGVAGGLATAYTGFSTLVAGISMGPLALQMFWLIGTGVVMWRRGAPAPMVRL